MPANLSWLQLDNAWVFSGEEGVADTVKAYLALEKKLLSYLTPEKRKTAKPIDISGARFAPALAFSPSPMLTSQGAWVWDGDCSPVGPACAAGSCAWAASASS